MTVDLIIEKKNYAFTGHRQLQNIERKWNTPTIRCGHEHYTTATSKSNKKFLFSFFL